MKRIKWNLFWDIVGILVGVLNVILRIISMIKGYEINGVSVLDFVVIGIWSMFTGVYIYRYIQDKKKYQILSLDQVVF